MTLTEEQRRHLTTMYYNGVCLNAIRRTLKLSAKELNTAAIECGLIKDDEYKWTDQSLDLLKECMGAGVSLIEAANRIGCSRLMVRDKSIELNLRPKRNHCWDSAKEFRLKMLVDDGLSASEIGRELGGVTRNAVIGKIHRMGWKLKKSTEPRKKVLKTTKRLPKKLDVPKFHYPETPQITKDGGYVSSIQVFQLQPGDRYVSFIDHKESQCRCIKEQGGKVVGYCAKPHEEGSRYCAEHTACFNKSNPFGKSKIKEGQAA